MFPINPILRSRFQWNAFAPSSLFRKISFPVFLPFQPKAWESHVTWVSGKQFTLKSEAHFAMGGSHSIQEMRALLSYLKESKFNHVCFGKESLVGHESWVYELLTHYGKTHLEASMKTCATQYGKIAPLPAVIAPSIQQILLYGGLLSFVTTRPKEIQMEKIDLMNRRIVYILSKEMCRTNKDVSFELSFPKKN